VRQEAVDSDYLFGKWPVAHLSRKLRLSTTERWHLAIAVDELGRNVLVACRPQSRIRSWRSSTEMDRITQLVYTRLSRLGLDRSFGC
jgi:hypothetical protein